MTTKSNAIAAAATALMIITAPATVLAQATAGAAGDGGTFGFGSAYQSVEADPSKRCGILRKRAQWSNAHYWWRKYTRCVATQMAPKS